MIFMHAGKNITIQNIKIFILIVLATGSSSYATMLWLHNSMYNFMSCPGRMAIASMHSAHPATKHWLF